MQRSIVVGDVHGCLDELRALLSACAWTPADRLVLAGDLVNKGPDSHGVVAFARTNRALSVLGNHDLNVLRVREQRGRGEPVKPDRARAADSLDDDDWVYLENLPPWLRLGPEREGEADTVVVHAGFVPGVPLERQEREFLLNIRSVTADGRPSTRIEGEPWAAHWRGPERVIFGHDAVRGLQQYPFATGLDTGCVYGGRLTAIILPERRLVSVPSARNYVGA